MTGRICVVVVVLLCGFSLAAVPANAHPADSSLRHLEKQLEAFGWTASVGISWPNAPWSRGRLDARVAEASAEIDTAIARQRVVENALRFAVYDAYVRVQSAARRAALLRTSIVPQSEQTLEVSRVAYQTDRVDCLVLIDNQRVLLDVQLAYYSALSDLEQALADLERAVGTDLTPDMLAPVHTEGQE